MSWLDALVTREVNPALSAAVNGPVPANSVSPAPPVATATAKDKIAMPAGVNPLTS